ncbi:MAG: hypothetical protein K2W82_09290 [Candidatus Obscuribacterales bacterium]|jgi:hypothetical protein|nr:hypothetical protein [Candidatus Obscuribacterales bacterium]
MTTADEEENIEPDIPLSGFTADGKEISYPGKGFPVVEIGADGWFSQDPRLTRQEDVPSVLIERRSDEHGILLDDLGERVRLVGLKFRGRDLYLINEKDAETGHYLVAWFDESWQRHHLVVDNLPLTVWMVRRIQTRSLDGELSTFSEIGTD